MKTDHIEIRDIHQMKGLTCVGWDELSMLIAKGGDDDDIELKCPILF